MNKYIKGDKIIHATQKAFDIIYRSKGFVPYVENTNNESIENPVVEEIAVDYSKLKKDDLLKIAKEKGIEIPTGATKDVIIESIKNAIQ